MLATNVQYKSNILPLQEPPPPEPTVGQWVFFIHRDRLMSGIVWGTIHTEIKRYKIDGVHPVVCEYIIEPDKGLSPWKYVTIHEDSIVWEVLQ